MRFDSSPDFEFFDFQIFDFQDFQKSQKLGLNQNAFIFELKKPYYLRFKSSIFKIAFRGDPTKIARSTNLWRICEFSVSQNDNFQILKNHMFQNPENHKTQNLGLNQNEFVFELKKPYYLRFKA